jgi:hypothetical protein
LVGHFFLRLRRKGQYRNHYTSADPKVKPPKGGFAKSLISLGT